MRFLCAFAAGWLACLVVGAEVPASLPPGLYAEIVTPRGTITAALFYQQTPLTVASFVGLAEGTLGPKPGTPFFNGLKFHRVVPNFVVQGGDPLGTGEGGPGFSFPDEFVPGLRHDSAGMLSMANDGPDTNGSQFFFTLREVNRLNYLHSVFGRVVRGIELLPAIRQDDPMTVVAIRRIGASAEAFRADPATFSALAAKTKKFSGATPPGPTAHFDDPDAILPTEPPRALAFQRKLANFERATGQKVYVRMVLSENSVRRADIGGVLSPPGESKARPDPSTPLASLQGEGVPPTLGNVAAAMAEKIGLPPDSVLAVYFADTGQWTLWIGEAYLPRFTGKSGEALQAFIREGGLHRAKRELFAKAHAQGESAIEDYIAHAPADKPITPAQKTKLHVDAVLDALLFTFEPR
jgi:cyclophilin family peptidyl-prolyl cis-trans isomerase